MGFYVRKSVRVGPLRFNLSGSGIGISTGIRGFRVGSGPRGNYIHMGSHGLYYRASLGHATPAVPVPLTPQEPSRAIAGLPEIEGGSVLKMAPASAQELLEEIRIKRTRLRLWPFHVAFGGLGLLAAASSASVPAWALFTALALLLASTAWVRAHDVLRKTVVLLYELDGPMAEAYQGLHNGFDWLAHCAAVWHLEAKGRTDDWKHQAGATHLVKRRAVRLLKGDPPWIRTNVEVPLLPVGRQTLYLLPDRLLVVDGSAVGAVEYLDLQVGTDMSTFIEADRVPADAQVIGHTWLYPNKSGGPDRRFKNNPQIPKVLYGDLRLRSASGLNGALQTSNKDAPAQFAAGVTTLAQAVKPAEISAATKPESAGVVPQPSEATPTPEKHAVSERAFFLGVVAGVPAALLVTGIVALNVNQAGDTVTTKPAQASAPPPSPLPSARRPGRVTGSGNVSHDALLGRGGAQRTAALSLMVRRLGQACSGTRNYFQRLEAESHDAIWNVACSNGKAYSVLLPSQAGVATKVVDCATLKVAGRECFRARARWAATAAGG